MNCKVFYLIQLIALSLFLAACGGNSGLPASSGGNNTPPPQVDTDATVNARVQATMSALGASPGSAASPGAAVSSGSGPMAAPPTPPSLTDPNPPLSLPFYDDFNDGLDPAWRVLSGTPLILDGALGAAKNQAVHLEIGNNDLRNYTITFDTAWDRRAYIYLTLTPSLQLYLREGGVYGEELKWMNFDGDQWREIQVVSLALEGDNKLRIVVSGNQYTVFLNGIMVSDLIYGDVRAAGSPLVLQIEDSGVHLDNFSIEGH